MPVLRRLSSNQKTMTQLALPTGASFHRGKSKQDFSTPQNFREAMVKRFGVIQTDLASDEVNAVGPDWFDESQNSLIQDWSRLSGLSFLNPPFGNIEPWAHKCRVESEKGANILFLIPASVGSNWWSLHVHNRATVYFCNPRLSFDGKAPFPKDIVLCHYACRPQNMMPGLGGFRLKGYECWRWR